MGRPTYYVRGVSRSCLQALPSANCTQLCEADYGSRGIKGLGKTREGLVGDLEVE